MMKLITFAFVLQFIIACWPKTDIMLKSWSALVFQFRLYLGSCQQCHS